MIIKKLIIFAILVLVVFTFAEEKYAGRKLVGYVPIWTSGAPVYTVQSNIKKIDFSKLSHAIIPFIFSDAFGNITYYDNYQTGAWSPENTVDSIIAISKQNNTKTLISLGSTVGGWNMTKNPEARTNFIKNIKNLMAAKQIDGLDLDLEGGWGSEMPFYIDEYILLAKELRDSLAGEFLLTAAIGAMKESWLGVPLWNKEFVELMDWVNIMVYDLHLWGADDIKNPSGMQDQINAAKTWGEYLDKEKLVFGVPFYSNGWDYDNNERYSNEINWWHGPTETDSSLWTWYPNEVYNYFILDSLFQPHPDADSILVTQDDKLWLNTPYSGMGFRGSHNGIIYLNGQTTLKNKAKWAIDSGYGGIMIWEVTGDVPTNHPRSLLAALAEQFEESTKDLTTISRKQAAIKNTFSLSIQNRVLKIALSNSNLADIKIFDSKGKVLYRDSKNAKEISINLNKKQFSNGIYFLQVAQNGSVKSAKFLIK